MPAGGAQRTKRPIWECLGATEDVSAVHFTDSLVGPSLGDEKSNLEIGKHYLRNQRNPRKAVS